MSWFRGKRVAVLGGAGFLGSHLCDRLLSEGATLFSVDNLITGSEQNIATLLSNPSFTHFHRDISRGLDLEGPLDFIFNLASPASPADYARLPIETLHAGSLGTENALMLAHRSGATLIQASTSEVYGDPLIHPQREDYFGNVDPVGPRAVYDEAKRYGETLVSAYHRTHGVNTRIARIFNTYGPRMRLDDGRVVPTFLRQALRREDLTVFGDGTQTRSFCYVSDLIDGLMRLAKADIHDPVNLGNPEEMTILEFAEAIAKATGNSSKLKFSALPRGDPKQRCPDITRARELLGWEPKVKLEQGLEQTIAFFRHRDKLEERSVVVGAKDSGLRRER